MHTDFVLDLPLSSKAETDHICVRSAFPSVTSPALDCEALHCPLDNSDDDSRVSAEQLSLKIDGTMKHGVHGFMYLEHPRLCAGPTEFLSEVHFCFLYDGRGMSLYRHVGPLLICNSAWGDASQLQKLRTLH